METERATFRLCKEKTLDETDVDPLVRCRDDTRRRRGLARGQPLNRTAWRGITDRRPADSILPDSMHPWIKSDKPKCLICGMDSRRFTKVSQAWRGERG